MNINFSHKFRQEGVSLINKLYVYNFYLRHGFILKL